MTRLNVIGRTAEVNISHTEGDCCVCVLFSLIERHVVMEASTEDSKLKKTPQTS